MGGMISNMSQKIGSASPGGGKSSPAPQNAYGSSYQAPAANVYQPSYSASQQQPTAQTQPSFEQSPFPSTPLNSSVNSTTTADMMGGNRGSGQGFGQVMQGLGMMGGGKSSGLGQGGYGMAPAFQQPQQQFNPFQQQFGGFQQQQFNPFQQQQFNPYQQQQFNPFQQQFGGFQQQPQGASGLQALFNNMMGQQQQMQQPIQQMPRFQSQALQFRPNMQNAQAALSRVRPSVQKQQQDAQAARIAELEAQLAGYNTPSGE
jgi:hypothetical protein